MASPELLRQVADRNLNATVLLYCTASVYVYRGEYANGGQRYPTAIKLLEYQMGSDSGVMTREITSMLALQHPNIVKLYDSAWLQVGVKHYLMIAMELCDKSLEKDNEDRRSHNYYWEEEKLWNVIRKLVSAFAFMQEQGYAHRDVKPMNIFLKQQEPIIGDFGSGHFADFTNPYLQSTLVGTPVYMSPLQRTALYSQNRKLSHNAFKSDVFSLGLTFYSMASLSNHAGMSSVANSLQSLFANISVLTYSEVFKGLLRWMLAWEEDQRCDFLEIQKWLSSPVQPNPPEISEVLEVPSYYTEQMNAQQSVALPPEYLYTNAEIPENAINPVGNVEPPLEVGAPVNESAAPFTQHSEVVMQPPFPTVPEHQRPSFEMKHEEAEDRKGTDEASLLIHKDTNSQQYQPEVKHERAEDRKVGDENKPLLSKGPQVKEKSNPSQEEKESHWLGCIPSFSCCYFRDKGKDNK